MAKWYAASYEAMFKPVLGGYVFQSPALMGDGRNHIVNEAQKTAIMNILERWVFLIIFSVSLAFPLMLGLAIGLITAVAAIWHASPGSFAVGIVVLLVLVGVVIVVVPIAYARRKLRPLLATLPTTEERITFRERSETAARTVSGVRLGLGLGLGVLMMFVGIMSVIYEQRVFFGYIFGFGIAFSAYCVWLIALRRRRR